ncbi:hypothetical protein Ancab_029907 [Ancistrocladus abbreviatus]
MQVKEPGSGESNTHLPPPKSGAEVFLARPLPPPMADFDNAFLLDRNAHTTTKAKIGNLNKVKMKAGVLILKNFSSEAV